MPLISLLVEVLATWLWNAGTTDSERSANCKQAESIVPGDPPAMPPLIIGPRTYAFCARVCAATHTHTRTRTAHMPPPPAPIYVDGLVSAHIYRLYDHVRTCALAPRILMSSPLLLLLLLLQLPVTLLYAW